MAFAKFKVLKRKELPRWADTLEMFNDFDFLADEYPGGCS